MAKYSKFIIALIGFALMGLKEWAGIDLGVTADQIWTWAVPLLTAIGVYGVPNKTA